MVAAGGHRGPEWSVAGTGDDVEAGAADPVREPSAADARTTVQVGDRLEDDRANGARRAGARDVDRESDRDQVDLTAVIAFLRRHRLIPPPREKRPVLGPGAEQLPLFEAPAPLRPASLAPIWLPAALREWDWAPDADERVITPDRMARLVVGAATLIYVWLFAAWTLRHHQGFGTQAFDYGIFDQGLWLLSKFKTPFISINGRNLFGDHTSFIMIFLVPFAWITSTANVLLVSQAVALGGAAVPVFLLARDRLRNEKLAAALALAYLLHPAVAFVNLDQYHPEVYEVPILMFALWFMVKHRWVGFLVCVGLALLVKEDVALMTFPLGVYVAFRHDRRIGAVTCAMSALAFLAALYWILPMLNGVGTLNVWRIPFGGPRGAITTALFHPGEFIAYATGPGRPWYVWQMFAPVALLPLFVPRFLLVGLAALASNALSTFAYQYEIQYHYSTLILPVLMGATIFAVARARTMAGRQILVGLVTASALVTAYLWGPTPLGRNEAAIANPEGPSIPYIRQAQALVPEDAILTAHYSYVPHVNHREKIYMFPNPFKANYWGTFKTEGQRLPQADTVQYVMFPTSTGAEPEPKVVLDQITPEFETIFEAGNVTLLKRVAPPAHPTPPPVPVP